MPYIVVFPVFNSEEVYYVDTLELAKQKIEDFCISQKEIDEARVFEITKKIDVKELFK